MSQFWKVQNCVDSEMSCDSPFSEKSELRSFHSKGPLGWARPNVPATDSGPIWCWVLIDRWGCICFPRSINIPIVCSVSTSFSPTKHEVKRWHAYSCVTKMPKCAECASHFMPIRFLKNRTGSSSEMFSNQNYGPIFEKSKLRRFHLQGPFGWALAKPYSRVEGKISRWDSGWNHYLEFL